MTRHAQAPAPGVAGGRLPGLDGFLRPGLPKYVGLHDAFVHAVTSGTWPPGSRLPNESELAALLPLSLGTIQRALRMLVDEGVIVRRPGAGSFVCAATPGAMRGPLHCRFVNDAGTGYLPVFATVVNRAERHEQGPWNAHLQVAAPLCIERVIRIADEFSVFSRFYVDTSRLPAFARLPLRALSGENFKEVILRESGLFIGRITQFLSTVTMPAEVARALHMRRAAAAERLDIEAFAGRESPLYFQTLWIPPNGRRLHLPGDGRDQGLGSESS